jgi:hypothetical protein
MPAINNHFDLFIICKNKEIKPLFRIGKNKKTEKNAKPFGTSLPLTKKMSYI